MTAAAAAQKMIEFYRISVRDSKHFLKVRGMAKAIGEPERRHPAALEVSSASPLPRQ